MQIKNELMTSDEMRLGHETIMKTGRPAYETATPSWGEFGIPAAGTTGEKEALQNRLKGRFPGSGRDFNRTICAIGKAEREWRSGREDRIITHADLAARYRDYPVGVPQGDSMSVADYARSLQTPGQVPIVDAWVRGTGQNHNSYESVTRMGGQMRDFERWNGYCTLQ